MEKNQEKFIEMCRNLKIVGASLLVCSEKEILIENNFGYRDIDSQKTLDASTYLRVASVSKMIGSLCLFKLYEEGKLSFDEDISTYLGFRVRNPKWEDVVITPKMLMLHTSSIVDGFDPQNPKIKKGYHGVNGTHDNVLLEELLTNTNSPYYTGLVFAEECPGTTWHYSNFSAGIIACIVEKITNMPFTLYLSNFLFEPLDIIAYFKVTPLLQESNIATLYSQDMQYPPAYFIPYDYPTFPLGNNYRGPAGGLFINNNGLITIVQLLLNRGNYKGKQIFQEATVDLMNQYQWATVDKQFPLTKAWQMEVLQKSGLRGLSGGAYGLRSFVFYDYRTNYGGSLLVNGFFNQDLVTSSQEMLSFLETVITSFQKFSKSTHITITPDAIFLPNRTIIDPKLFLKKMMKALLFCDMLGIVGRFDSKNNSLTILYKNKKYQFKNLTLYQNYYYLDLFKSLEVLSIPCEQIKNHINITILEET